MSRDESFGARWSRLKREKAQQTGADPAPAQPEPPRDDDTAAALAQPSPDAPPGSTAFDPASLPPIESITGSSDIRAFLQSGVPADLTKAALRRAWTSDPAIRDFIGIAENQWDFTDPSSIPGFGPLAAIDDVGKLVAQAMGKIEAAAPPTPDVEVANEPAPTPLSNACSTTDEGHDVELALPSADTVEAAVAADRPEGKTPADFAPVPYGKDPKGEIAVERRRHGSALPK